MKVLMVIESVFGNTRQLGEAVAAGLTEGGAAVQLVGVDDAPAAVDGVDLVVVGAPTHSRGLSTPATRAQAAKSGAAPVGGVREWLGSVTLPDAPVVVFDTATSHGWLSGSAAKAAAKLLAQRSPSIHAAARTFLVAGTQGPLQSGELEAAHAWGRELAGS